MTEDKDYTSEKYCSISYDDLLVFALFSLSQKGLDATFENLVVECFSLFPERFGLPGYKNLFPDSAQVEKSWLRCRTDKGLITGNKAQGFKLTERGLNVVRKVQRLLETNIISLKRLRTLKDEKRTKNSRLILQLEKSTAYSKFTEAHDVSIISDYEFCDMLYCSLDSLAESRRNNVKQLKIAVSDQNRTDLLNFLDKCERKFKHLLYDINELNKEYKGGMHKRKINKEGQK